jgi:hypothetical protein
MYYGVLLTSVVSLNLDSIVMENRRNRYPINMGFVVRASFGRILISNTRTVDLICFEMPRKC